MLNTNEEDRAHAEAAMCEFIEANRERLTAMFGEEIRDGIYADTLIKSAGVQALVPINADDLHFDNAAVRVGTWLTLTATVCARVGDKEYRFEMVL